LREHRLYEASFLLRDYGFCLEDLPFSQEGQLPLDVDPKYAWAKENLKEHPIEINKADKHLLLRIPGIGPKSVNSILQTRINNRIINLDELYGLGVNIKRAAPFIVINGKSPVYQTSFF
jgi:predicted DNA-binding helix-hairpin-helix protein